MEVASKTQRGRKQANKQIKTNKIHTHSPFQFLEDYETTVT